jgi:outer membrane biosynthesis protein TonB
MRSTCRLFLAAILFIGVAGVVSAQDPNPAPPSTGPDLAVTPVPELPPIPAAEANAPAVEPAPPADQSVAPTVEPAPAPVVNPPAPERLPDSVVTTTKRVRTTKKITKKPVEKPAIQESEPAIAVGAAVSAAAVGTTSDTPPPPGAAASTAPPASIAPPPPPAAEKAAVENNSEQTKPQREMGIGGWIIAALAVIGLVGIIVLIRRRNPKSRTSIADHSTGARDLKPILAQRP